jgi:hypothetical protein
MVGDEGSENNRESQVPPYPRDRRSPTMQNTCQTHETLLNQALQDAHHLCEFA